MSYREQITHLLKTEASLTAQEIAEIQNRHPASVNATLRVMLAHKEAEVVGYTGKRFLTPSKLIRLGAANTISNSVLMETGYLLPEKVAQATFTVIA